MRWFDDAVYVRGRGVGPGRCLEGHRRRVEVVDRPTYTAKDLENKYRPTIIGLKPALWQ